MITAAKAKSITKQFAANSPFYADVCEGRKNHRCHRYTINENLYFEYVLSSLQIAGDIKRFAEL